MKLLNELEKMFAARKSNFVICCFISILFINLYFYRLNVDENKENHLIEKKSNENSDKVRHVFFDLGANRGDTIQNFFGLSKRALGGDISSLFKRDFIQNNKWIVYAFEANYLFDKPLQKTMQDIITIGHQFILYNSTAVWINDGHIEFFIRLVKNNNNHGGSSLKEPKKQNDTEIIKVKVPCVDFSRILREYNQNDVIVAKLDIEGAEYELLSNLISKDLIKLIDYLIVEYHPSKSEHQMLFNKFQKTFKSLNIHHTVWN